MWYIELGKTVIKVNANFITNSQDFIKGFTIMVL